MSADELRMRIRQTYRWQAVSVFGAAVMLYIAIMIIGSKPRNVFEGVQLFIIGFGLYQSVNCFLAAARAPR